MQKKGAFVIILLITTFFGAVIGFVIENVKLGFLLGMGIGVAFATALTAGRGRR